MLTASEPILYDIKFLANNLRASDGLEVDVHLHKKQTREARLLQSVDVSKGCLVIRDNNVPICIFGVARGEDDSTGIPWMLGTDDLLKHSAKVARWGKLFVEAMQEEYALLKNIVYAGNEISQRWLEWMGFVVIKDKPFDMSGEPFYLFYRIGDEYV